MRTVTVSLPHQRYDIKIGSGFFQTSGEGTDEDNFGNVLFSLIPSSKVCVISDSNVAPLYIQKLSETLIGGGYKDVASYVLPAGEEHKTLEQVYGIYDFLFAESCERGTPIIALGGGVVGDTAGFAASTFLRGLPFVQLPTTLLSMIDASVGGKVGVNLPQGKNLVGSFYQPRFVGVDVACLKTLPEREFRGGMAECIKHAMLSGSEFIAWLEHNHDSILDRQPQVLEELVAKNLAIKSAIVMEDERENGKRAWLNLGHTYAHAIEVTTGYSLISHGEAVSLGLVAVCVLAAKRKLWPFECVLRVEQLLSSVGLPIRAELESDDDLLRAMAHDKKVAKHKIRYVLPKVGPNGDPFGSVDIFDDLLEEEIVSAIRHITRKLD